MHCDNTKPVYIQNYVGVYLALGREKGGRGGERKRERQRIKEEKEKRCLCERDRRKIDSEKNIKKE